MEKVTCPTKLMYHPKQQLGVLKSARRPTARWAVIGKNSISARRPTARWAVIGKNSISPKARSISAYFW